MIPTKIEEFKLKILWNNMSSDLQYWTSLAIRFHN